MIRRDLHVMASRQPTIAEAIRSRSVDAGAATEAVVPQSAMAGLSCCELMETSTDQEVSLTCTAPLALPALTVGSEGHRVGMLVSAATAAVAAAARALKADFSSVVSKAA